MNEFITRLTREDYMALKNSGMFWVYFPEATGNYEEGMMLYEGMSNFVDPSCEVDTSNLKYDTVHQPKHYQFIEGYQVKDITKIVLDRIQESDMNIPLNSAGWLQQSLQYLLRCYEKGGVEDLKKAHETLGFALKDIEGNSQQYTYKKYPESDS